MLVGVMGDDVGGLVCLLAVMDKEGGDVNVDVDGLGVPCVDASVQRKQVSE